MADASFQEISQGSRSAKRVEKVCDRHNPPSELHSRILRRLFSRLADHLWSFVGICGAGLDSWLTINQHSCSLLRCRITRCVPCLPEEEEKQRQPNAPPHWGWVDAQQHALTFLLIFVVKPQSLLVGIGHANKRTHGICGTLWIHTIATAWMVLFDFKMVPVVSEAPLCCICGTAEDQPCRSRRAYLWRRSTNPLQRIFSIGVW